MSSSDPGWRALSGGPLTSVEAVEPGGVRYLETGLLGRGGMGRVVAVEDRWLGREVARKVTLDADPAVESRLRNEAKVTARLEHPGIVPVYDLGRTDEGRLYYTMRLVRGQSLADALQDADDHSRRMALLRHLLDVCQAVAYAHAHGVIHRDLKPENILLGTFGETLVADWGLAVDLQGTAAATGVAGTPGWMAPEQERGTTDSRTDVWALGRLIDGIGVQGATELEAIVRCATEPEPSHRYADAGLLAQDLAAFLDGRPVSAHAYSPTELLVRAVVAWRPWIAAFLLSALVVMGFGAWSWSRTSTQFARTLVRDALHALEDEQLPEAGVLAAHAVERTGNPEARGVVLAVRGAPGPALIEQRRLPACRHLTAARGLAACVTHDNQVRWLQGVGPELNAERVRVFDDGHFVAQQGASILLGDAEGVEEVGTTTYRFRWTQSGSTALGWTKNKLITVKPDGSMREERVCPIGPGLHAVAPLSDGLALVCGDRIRVASVGGDRELPLPPADLGKVTSAASQGSSLYLGTVDGRVVRWNLVTGVRTQAADTPLGEIRTLTSVAGGLAVTGRRHGLRILHPDTLATVAVLPHRRWHAVQPTTDGFVAWGETRNTYRVEEPLRPFRHRFPSGLSSLEVSEDGRWMVTTHGDGRAVLTDLHTGERTSSEPLVLGAAAKWSTFDDDQAWVAVPTGGVYRFSLPQWEPELFMEVYGGRRVGQVEVEGSRATVFVGYAEGLWVEGQGRQLTGQTFVDADFRDGDAVFLDETGQIWRLGPARLVRTEPDAHTLAIGPGGEVAVAGDGFVALHPYRYVVPDRVHRLVLTEDWLVAALKDGTIRILERSGGETVAVLRGHQERVVDLALHGSLLRSASWDGTVRSWDLSALAQPQSAREAEAVAGIGLEEVLGTSP